MNKPGKEEEAVERYLSLFREYRAADQIRVFEHQRCFRNETVIKLRKCEEELFDLMESDNPKIYFALGLIHSLGLGRKFDSSQAVHWFEKAAKLGHVESMRRLAGLLKRGGESNDLKASFAWYMKAANLGDTGAMVFVAFAYREGTGVEQNPTKAAEWFERAIDHGDLRTLVLVGKLYCRTLGEAEKGLETLHRAAELGFRDADIELAFLYGDRGFKLYDPKKAVEWNWRILYHKTDITRPGALYRLSQYYWNGDGVEKNAEQAKSLLGELVAMNREQSDYHKKALALLSEIESSLL
ncbi:tetratricopeptide repeat protein [Pelagicoccus sp. SDUM812002]|uniref:tetratricopeptide repeat protein n=1 Tax=Pelagicoccus sp. SDUM812002 TaxID=3041266 RepID=UPI00280E3ED7|nr:tetratricopeptide repeat protein [Pelagicoccus sp. SDUM812002]MDQ8184290.1 tetratricopeptide repeat protein [Pelagicoccus sp. SDUM812002]